MRTSRLLLLSMSTVALIAAIATAGTAVRATGSLNPTSRAVAVAAPGVRHVSVINPENKGFDQTFGPTSPATYLTRTLRPHGQLLTQYGTAPNSLPNYLAQVSGRVPNPETQAECQLYSVLRGSSTAGALVTVSPQQAVGSGCVYPRLVNTVADQLVTNDLS